MQIFTKGYLAAVMLTSLTCSGNALAAGQVSPDLKLRGSVVSTWSFMNFPGLDYVPCTPDGMFVPIDGADIVAEYGAYDDGKGRYYMGWLEDWGMISFPHLSVYNTETWEEFEWPDCDHSILCTDNAVDPTTGDVYGCFYHYDNAGEPALAWAKADYPGGMSQALRVLDASEQMYGVACDGNGQYYGMLADGSLVAVDKTTGEFTKIGDTGLRPYYTSSATFDDKSGNIIFSYAPATGKSSLWAIDPADATATLLVEYVDNEQIAALEVVKPEAEDLAPAAPILSVEVPGGDMELLYKIEIPASLFNGNAASGPVRWVLSVDGEEVASGESTFGASVEGSVTLSDKGLHTVIAYLENETGKSPRAKTTVVNGAGTPLPPSGLVVNNFGGGEISLFWGDVTDSTDGAYIDPAAITYTVKRNGEVIAEGLKDTWLDDIVEIPSTYVKLTYEVIACYAENLSEPAVASTGIGAVTPPYSSRLDSGHTDKDAGLYTIIDANSDSSTWWFSPSYEAFLYDYSTENIGDDWLISPAFHLESGKTYELSYSVSGNSKMYTERYAVAMGGAPVAAAMTTELLPPTEISTERAEPIEMRLTVQPKSDGDYYFGWHALSDANMFQIHLRDIRVSSPMIATSPSEATDITLERDADGKLSLHGSFKAPASDISGNPLKSLGKIIVSRDGKIEPVAEFASVVPGAIVEFDDLDLPAIGQYTYHILCHDSEGGAGREVRASAFVGPYAPQPVPSVRLVETSTPGRVVLSWDAPAEDISGHALLPENLTYMVYVAGNYQAEPVLDAPVSSNSLTLDVCSPDEKEFALFYVSALNVGVECEDLTRSPMIPVGKAESLPYLHSFTQDDIDTYLLGYMAQAGTYGSLSAGNPANDGIPSADGDDAFLIATQYESGATLDFFTGKIDLSNAANPALVIRHYKWSDADTNTFSVFAVTPDGKRTEVGYFDHAEAGDTGWNVAVCPLTDVKGKVVEIGISACFYSHDSMPFDALAISDMPDYDLAATSVNVPARVEPLKPFNVTGTVANLGLLAAKGYTVELLENGLPVASLDGDALDSGRSQAVSFSHTLSPLHTADPEMAIRVSFPGDSNPANDVSPVAKPKYVASKFPAVQDLTATEQADGVALSWSAPSTEGFELDDTENFENAEAWTEEVDGWTMVDVDGAQIGTLEGASLPDAVGMRTAHSFFVFDSASDDIIYYNPDLKYLVQGQSGSHSLVAMYILSQNLAQDDWAISPLLSGEKQTISFYARSFHPEYPDHLEVLYSLDDSTDPLDFISLCEDGAFEVPQLVDAVGNATYQHYEFNLPEGTKRFALRAHNEGGDGFMLMIDDVTFKQANASLGVKHYDIYRDGLCVNDAPVTATSYLDTDVPDGKHVYNVVVSYNRGISGGSNDAILNTTGIETILASGINVAVEGQVIIVSGAHADVPVSLHTTSGTALHIGSGDCRISVAPGIYLLTIGRDTVKVLVR